MTGLADVPEVAPVRPGEHLAWDRLEAHLRRQLGDEVAGPCTVLQFPNGAANLTYLLRFGDHAMVLRRPPFGRLAPGSHDMRREYRVLSVLWRSFPRAPRALHLCLDASVIGSDFVVLEYRRGEVIRGGLPLSMRDIPAAGRIAGEAVVDALAQLHELDPDGCGLGDLGRPRGFAERQVSGWWRRWQLVAPRGDPSPIMAAVGEALSKQPPVPQRVSILHNDYKVDNCQFGAGRPGQVTSIFDWDMATIGDPLFDLGTLLNYWPDPADRPGEGPIVAAGLELIGMPTRHEVVDRYGAATGMDTSMMWWYEAFGSFKLAVVNQQLYSRWQRGESTDARMAGRAEVAARMARRSARLLGVD